MPPISTHPLHELLPTQRSRSLRKKGHAYILPSVRTECHKRCFETRCLFNFILSYCFLYFCNSLLLVFTADSFMTCKSRRMTLGTDVSFAFLHNKEFLLLTITLCTLVISKLKISSYYIWSDYFAQHVSVNLLFMCTLCPVSHQLKQKQLLFIINLPLTDLTNQKESLWLEQQTSLKCSTSEFSCQVILQASGKSA